MSIINLYQYLNLAEAKIQGTLTAIQTVITVQSGEDSNISDPNLGSFPALIYDYNIGMRGEELELVLVTSKTGLDYTVTRAFGETTARAFNSPGADYRLAMVITAEQFGIVENNFQDIKLSSGYVNIKTLTGSLGTVNIIGSTGGYAGFNFNSVNRKFIINETEFGITDETDTFIWKVIGGTLNVGAVPWNNLSGVPSTFPPSAHTLDSHSGNLTPTRVATDANYRFVTDAEKIVWSGKQDALGFTPENSANKGAINGYCPLDSNQLVPVGNLPPITGADSIQFNTALSLPSHSEGLLFYDNVNKTLALYPDEADVLLQIGQENWVRAKNITGSTITNGQLIYINGEDLGIKTVALAQANSDITSAGTLAMATHDVETGTIGIFTRVGTVRYLDTSSYSARDILYLSSDVPGGYTNIRQTSPNYDVKIGVCSVSSLTEGEIEIDISAQGNTSDVIKIFNGSILEDHFIEVVSNGTTVTLSLEKNGGGDLSLFFDGLFYVFDTTPAAIVVLTPGSDQIPTLNYVYIPDSTKTLTSNTSGFPTGEQFIPIATVLLQSAVSAQTDGAYKVHAWTNHLSNNVGEGHINHVNKWIRYQNATWLSGVAISFTGTGTGTVNLSTSAGTVLQLHEYIFPAFSSPGNFYIVNDFTTPYRKTNNIASIIADALGNSLASSTFCLVFWGCVSESESDCKIYCNLPSGSYGANKPDDAREDISKYTNYSIPNEFKGTGFLLYRLVVTTNPGLTSYTLYIDGAGDDLRGQFPNNVAGTSTSTITQFADNIFSIFNISDDTKRIVFDASNITTGNTRTISMADVNINLADIVLNNSHRSDLTLHRIINDTGTSLTELWSASKINSELLLKAPITDPTFIGELGIGVVNVSETELGILEGATITTTELNYLSGVTSSIQTQLGTKAPLINPNFTNNVGIGTSTFGASADKVLAISNGTPPTSQPANLVQLYAKDVSTSSELFAMNEAGDEFQLTKLGGSKTLLATITVSSPVSSVEFLDTLWSAGNYESLQIVFSELSPSSSGLLRLDIKANDTYSTIKKYNVIYTTTTTVLQTDGVDITNYIPITPTIHVTGTAHYGAGVLNFINFSTYPFVYGNLIYSLYSVLPTARLISNFSMQGIKFSYDSGNIAAGVFKLYGIL